MAEGHEASATIAPEFGDRDEVKERGHQRRSTEIILAAGLLLLVGLLVHPYRAQQASRYALTAAVVERGTVVLDDYENVLGIDKAVRDGHLYSDKAPGQPILAIPVFALGKVFGVEGATILRIDGNLGLWWVTLWSAAIPGAALLLMIHRRAKRLDAQKATAATVAIFFGTLLLPFSALLFGHVLAAGLLYGSYLLLVEEASKRRLLVAGILAGLAVTVEYTTILGVFVLGVVFSLRIRRQILMFIAGGVIPALGLLAYNAIAFGNPLSLSYQYSALSGVPDGSVPLLTIFSSASVDNVMRLLFDGRGLLVATPVVIVAVAGTAWQLRKGRQIDAVMAIAMFSVFVLLPIFWGNPWGGDSPGARYLTPALPFLGPPLVWSWRRWPRITFVATGISIVTMVAATLTDPVVSRFSNGGLGLWVTKLIRGETVDTLLTTAWGPIGWGLHVTLLFSVVGLFLWSRVSGDRQGGAV